MPEGLMPCAPAAFHRRRRLVGVLLLGTLCVLGAALPHAGAAGGSDSELIAGPKSVLSDRPLQESLNEAMGQRKLLIVVIAAGKSAVAASDKTWSNPVLARWAQQHAVVARVGDKETLRILTEVNANPGGSGDPVLFKDGKQIRMFGSGLPQGKSRLANPAKPSSAFLGLLLKLDWTIRSFEQSDAGWYQQHSAPEAAVTGEPEGGWAWQRTDDAGTAASDLKPGPDGEYDLLGRLAEARKLAAGDKPDELRRAVGLYCWLWERSGLVEPAFEPTRLLILPGEMYSLAQKHKPAQERWIAMRQIAIDRLSVRDYPSLFSVFMLSRVIGDYEENLRFIDDALNDVDAAAMMPRHERLAYEAMLPQIHWNPPDPVDPEKTLQRAAAVMQARKPDKMNAEGWKQLQDLRAYLFTLKCCRAYAGLLAQDKGELAAKVPSVLVSGQDTAAARLALVYAAVAAGGKPADAAGLLDEAEKKGGRKYPALRAGVEKAEPKK